MKRILYLFSVICCLLITVSVVYADNSKDSSSLAENTVRLHFFYMDKGRVSETELYTGVSADVNEYLKIKEIVNKRNHVDVSKSDYGCTTSIAKQETIGNFTYFKVAAKVSWLYEGAAEHSGYAQPMDVIIDNNSGLIVDLYEPRHPFDTSVRGEIDIKNEKNRLTSETVKSAREKYNIDTTSETAVGGTDAPTDIQATNTTNINIWAIVGIGAGILFIILFICLIIKKQRSSNR